MIPKLGKRQLYSKNSKSRTQFNAKYPVLNCGHKTMQRTEVKEGGEGGTNMNVMKTDPGDGHFSSWNLPDGPKSKVNTAYKNNWVKDMYTDDHPGKGRERAGKAHTALRQSSCPSVAVDQSSTGKRKDVKKQWLEILQMWQFIVCCLLFVMSPKKPFPSHVGWA